MRQQWNLKEIRQMYGLSQSDIAKSIGIKSRSTVVAIENGERDLSSEELGRLADSLGVEIGDLLSFEIPDYAKYREMLIEVLRQYSKHTNHGVPKTLFAKLVYFADFAWFYDQLKPMSGMKYRRDPFGPVPDQFFKIVDNMIEKGELKLELKLISDRKNQMQFLSLADYVKSEPNQYLTAKEIDLIAKIVQKWHGSDVDKIVEFTHNQLPWQVTRPNEFIAYELITQEDPDNVY